MGKDEEGANFSPDPFPPPELARNAFAESSKAIIRPARMCSSWMVQEIKGEARPARWCSWIGASLQSSEGAQVKG